MHKPSIKPAPVVKSEEPDPKSSAMAESSSAAIMAILLAWTQPFLAYLIVRCSMVYTIIGGELYK